ncbi:hypothetical protein Fmac_016227 [Flemingia macrophylla]|uniref:Uncharacterized protein n=1 Tax=Flemingia macrophylla TaxID=520843 RepID=A0ABD1MGY6_9FABA
MIQNCDSFFQSNVRINASKVLTVFLFHSDLISDNLLLKVARVTMSLACLVCHSVDSPSPSHSFRSYSVSSSENEGRCHAVATCLTRKLSLPPSTMHTFLPPSSSSKVTPQPTGSSNNTPRLVRSRAVTRDRVRNWNFDEIATES